MRCAKRSREPQRARRQSDVCPDLLEFLLKFGHGFEDHVADNRQVARADFIECVLRSVPIAQLMVAIQIDDVHGGNSPLYERAW